MMTLVVGYHFFHFVVSDFHFSFLALFAIGFRHSVSAQFIFDGRISLFYLRVVILFNLCAAIMSLIAEDPMPALSFCYR